MEGGEKERERHKWRIRSQSEVRRRVREKEREEFQALFVAPTEDDVNVAVAAELNRNGWHAKKAANEEEALRVFEASVPNVLVLDARRHRKSVDNWDPCHIAQYAFFIEISLSVAPLQGPTQPPRRHRLRLYRARRQVSVDVCLRVARFCLLLVFVVTSVCVARKIR